MADDQAATGGLGNLKNQPFSSRGAQMDRHTLGQVVLRLQAQYIRSSLAKEIEEFENTFEEILQAASVFLVTTQRVSHAPSLVIVDEASVIKTVCHFLASSNTILEFLDFQRRKTGLASGGDSSLEKQVKAAQALVAQLLSALLLHMKSETYPGKESGLIYNEDVKIFGGMVFHKNAEADYADIPDPADDGEGLLRCISYWHPETLFHPLRHVPGTPWHKFFGNLQVGETGNPALFRKRKSLPAFKVIIPETIEWLVPELRSNYDTYREIFENTRRMPGPRLPEYIRNRRLSTLFEGWKRFDDRMDLHPEDMSDIPCPEFDLLGLSRLESLNAHLNATDLAGISLLGAEIPRVPVILTGESRRYCLEFDGQWDA
ncbi:uncharacterized protein THITE_2127265 [Thermothielavioides terrestris NRRL 8126]|uniref:Uncharacterized protein n=1 Tax=Thermothielavioides terrestris (strain ATCC 38088 / NRRL 8126) TaxID=578455 RepID=G2R2Q2_THETT|nr:uncharacterized protein THITE_2127265 [Thermothielavioides terrestris NRRL 8126]AEO65013.1 hypothetical protein THITE_2127265 [Thermothielavioides terrestris NRRL 8126]